MAPENAKSHNNEDFQLQSVFNVKGKVSSQREGLEELDLTFSYRLLSSPAVAPALA